MVTENAKRLKMRKFTVRVLVVPTLAESMLTGAQSRYETREIEGYTLADAKRRAGIV